MINRPSIYQAQVRLDDLIPKKNLKAGGRMMFGANSQKPSTERTINMKAKSSKQSKKDKPAVKIKDLKPTKDAKGGANPGFTDSVYGYTTNLSGKWSPPAP